MTTRKGLSSRAEFSGNCRSEAALPSPVWSKGRQAGDGRPLLLETASAQRPFIASRGDGERRIRPICRSAASDIVQSE